VVQSKPLRNDAPATDPQYGSDEHGLICAFRFRPGRPAEAIDGRTALAVAGDGAAEDAFVWLHFSLSNAASERWLRQHLVLPPAFFEDLREHAPTRLEDAGDHLLAVLNDVVYLGSDASAASSMHACIGPRTFITARVTPLRSVDRLRANVRAGRTFRSACGLLAHLLTDQADVLVRVVRDATRDVDLIEDKLLEGRSGETRARLGALRRVLVRLQRVLAPEPAALFRLLTRPPRWMDEDDLGELRMAAEELSAAVADAAALGERVRLIQEEIAALVNERTGRTLFVLTVVTVLALPMTIIPGLFGMNVGGIPFGSHEHGFWLAFAVALSTAGAGFLLVRVLRR
jgi:zinc transporter